MAISSELERLLSAWLPRQPWFPRLGSEFGADPDVTPMSETLLFENEGEDGHIIQAVAAILAVGEGKSLRRLNVPLIYRTHEDFSLRSHLVGVINDLTLGQCWVYDACADPLFVLGVAKAMAQGKRYQGGQVQALQVTRGTSGFDELDSLDALMERAAATTLSFNESRGSESQVFLDDPAYPSVLTFFRVLTPGMSAGVRIPVVLTSAGSQAVPPVIGWTGGRWFDARDLITHTAPLAMLTGSEVATQAAWRDAVDTALRVDSGSIGSFNKRAAALGARVGELHKDLAREFGQVKSDERQVRGWVSKWSDRVDWALARAPLALSSLEPQLRKHRKAVRAMESLGSLQRIHGDLTLNHVTVGPQTGFTAVNFADSVGVDDPQTDPKPAAIDLVALLRSIDYAAGYARLARTGALDGDAQPATLGITGLDSENDELAAVADSPENLWSQQAQNALLSGYSHAVDASIGFNDPVLRAVLIDRLLVEVVAELRNRPAWLIVPLASLALLLGSKGPKGSEGARKSVSSWPAPQHAVSAEEFAQASTAAPDLLTKAFDDAEGVEGAGGGDGGGDGDRAVAVAADVVAAQAAAGENAPHSEADTQSAATLQVQAPGQPEGAPTVPAAPAEAEPGAAAVEQTPAEPGDGAGVQGASANDATAIPGDNAATSTLDPTAEDLIDDDPELAGDGADDDSAPPFAPKSARPE